MPFQVIILLNEKMAETLIPGKYGAGTDVEQG